MSVKSDNVQILSSLAEHLIPVINKIQDAITSVEDKDHTLRDMINLPQIAVVGAQSVGKTSLIESLVGKDFLPRGQGMVTKCPLIIQLNKLCYKDQDENSYEEKNYVKSIGEDYGTFNHAPNRIFSNYKDIMLEIQNQTKVLVANDAVSSSAITLKLYGPNFVNLTFIDLPGIIKVPTADQPADLVERIRKIIEEVIKNPNCIILAVSAANIDLANSDSLQMASSLDPEGSRTIGVISKCDTIEDGRQLVDILEGKVFPLKLGYVLTRCRTQRETDAGENIDKSLKAESKFFRSHPDLSFDRVRSKSGVPYLARLLSCKLTTHIQKELPRLHRAIEQSYQEKTKKLEDMGDPVDKHSAGVFLYSLFRRFESEFNEILDGRNCQRSLSDTSGGDFENKISRTENFAKTKSLVGGARLNFLFQGWFAKTTLDYKPLTGLSDDEIDKVITLSSGWSGSLFLPDFGFETLIRRQIKKLEAPALHCARQVSLDIERMMNSIFLTEWNRFSKLRQRMKEIFKVNVEKQLNETCTQISTMIKIELSMINKSHPDFVPKENFCELLGKLNDAKLKKDQQKAQAEKTAVSTAENNPKQKQQRVDLLQDGCGGNTWTLPTLDRSNSLSAPLESKVKGEVSSEVELVKLLIESYFKIVQTKVADVVPKIIMCFFVDKLKETIPAELMLNLCRPEEYSSLIEEDKRASDYRISLEKERRALSTARSELATVFSVE